ncbi:MAG TPA: GAF domain-containing protein [Negativicutes bacterium]|nr:GAF domain-containing protein [Negativicutes bacterium]
MSLTMNSLLDIEKYFILELSYFDNCEYPNTTISPDNPIPISAFLESVPDCYCAFELAVRVKYKDVKRYIRESYERLKQVYDASENLKDLEIIGYINDNHNFLGNTRDKHKTSLVAFALRDSLGNGMVVYRGCEINYFSNIILDWGGCVTSALGHVTNQHKKALEFYDTYMKDLPGERNILGHSKGGNLATYVYINRKSGNVNTYIVNAQPYCWFAMNAEQKSWLKSGQFEYLVHAADATRFTNYAPYISRVIPLNRYVKNDVAYKHLFFSARFDDYGNLEGGRILRQTHNKTIARVLNDHAGEKRKTKDELIELFSDRMQTIRNSARFLSVGMDEILLALNAQAATLWLKSGTNDGADEFIYPFLIKGPVNDELYKLKLRRGEGIASDCAFNGAVRLVGDMKQDDTFFGGIDKSTGFSSASTITVPLRCDSGEIIGALQILNKNERGGFTRDDLDLALAMSEIIGSLITSESLESFSRDFVLLSITNGSELVFEIEKSEYKELFFNNAAEQKWFLERITGVSLEDGDLLQFNREHFTGNQKEELASFRRLEVSVLFEGYGRQLPPKNVKDILSAKAHAAREKAINIKPVLGDVTMAKIANKRLCDLTEDELVQFELERALLSRPMLIIYEYPCEHLSGKGNEIVLKRLQELAGMKVVTVITLMVK